MNSIVMAAVISSLLPGCRPSEVAEESTPPAEPAKTDPNRIDIPAPVRQNLGITFVSVEKRPVQSTVRIAGQFELRPKARREYHVMLPGRIELLVQQYQTVEPGQPLFHLDSPEWQKMQSEMVAAQNAMKRSHADLEVAEARKSEVQMAIAFLEKRLKNLAEANVRRVDLEAELADKQNVLPRLTAELAAASTDFDAAHSGYDVMLDTAASLAGISKDELDPAEVEHAHLRGIQPPWRSIDRLTIWAEAAGVVDRLAVTNRGWANTGDLVLDTIDPSDLRFHGDALQTDINLFSNGQRARIVPPQGGSIDLQDTIDGTIMVGMRAHPEQRTIPIYLSPKRLPQWAKAGVTAYLEVFGEDDASPVLAIPQASVIRDGLEVVFFRRDPRDPNVAVRTEADLGASDGRWVEVKSGVMLGDEIVLDGVYPLMLATSSSGERQEGGHFHADGTFHDEDH
jgi:multidrug efflux pump subunit AcrA (membrane-fusion protein)